MREQRGEHRRHAGKAGDLLRRDLLEHRFGVEARVQHDFRSAADAEQHVDRQRVDVKRRQHRKNAFLALDEHRRRAVDRLPVLPACRPEVAVGQHRALGRTGRAAGVLQHRDRLARIGDRMRGEAAVVVEQCGKGDMPVVAADVDGLLASLHLCRHRLGRRRHLGDVADDELAQPRRAEHHRHLRIERRQVEREDEVGAAVLDLVFQHLRRVERRVIDDRAAGFEHAKECDHVVRRIRQVQPDVNPRADAQALQPLGRAVGLVLKLAVAQASAHEFERRLVRPLRRGVVEDARHRQRLDRDVPAHSLGVRMNPRHFAHRCLLRVGVGVQDRGTAIQALSLAHGKLPGTSAWRPLAYGAGSTCESL